jgi:hypothetical protein
MQSGGDEPVESKVVAETVVHSFELVALAASFNQALRRGGGALIRQRNERYAHPRGHWMVVPLVTRGWYLSFGADYTIGTRQGALGWVLIVRSGSCQDGFGQDDP